VAQSHPSRQTVAIEGDEPDQHVVVGFDRTDRLQVEGDLPLRTGLHLWWGKSTPTSRIAPPKSAAGAVSMNGGRSVYAGRRVPAPARSV
jgi:hypothetical protein